jgi:probable F420-dependent oxidoreductase
MEIGVNLPNAGRAASPALVRDVCQAAEELGFDGLWTIEHLVAPVHTDSLYTLGREPSPIADGAVSATMGLNLEQNTTLAYAASVTTRALLGTMVAVLPLRNPVLNARQLATIDQYSGGRLLYGVGVGWLKEEADAMGMPWEQRAARSEEHIALMRALWTAEGDVVEFKGRFWTLPPMDPQPRPVQRPIPILIGGHSDAALDRAARIGDGWIGAGMSVGRLGELRDRLGAACERHGRPLESLRLVCGGGAVRGDHAGGPLGATPDEIIAELGRYAALGLDHLNVGGRASSPEATMAWLAAFGRDVLPAFR